MRLIDLDEIKPIDFPSYEMDGLDVVRYLNTLPTVNAVPVGHAKWKEIKTEVFMGMKDGAPVWEDRSLFMCPRCSFKIRNRIRYCGRCGAKMDGGNEDGTAQTQS